MQGMAVGQQGVRGRRRSINNLLKAAEAFQEAGLRHRGMRQHSLPLGMPSTERRRQGSTTLMLDRVKRNFQRRSSAPSDSRREWTLSEARPILLQQREAVKI